VIYLSGAVKQEYADAGLGFMKTPWMGNRLPDGATWAADNGCFRRPEAYSDDWYLSWLDKQPREGCLFATAPDVVGDAWASFDRSYPVFQEIRRLGFPAALVAQDGFDLIDDDRWSWDLFDALFLGGSYQPRSGDEWKVNPAYDWGGYGYEYEARPAAADWSTGARHAVMLAKTEGKWVHMGRVNSGKRVRLAHEWGCDSSDGTYLSRAGLAGLANVLSWLAALDDDDTPSALRLTA
jgi:hypothetical protein